MFSGVRTYVISGTGITNHPWNLASKPSFTVRVCFDLKHFSPCLLEPSTATSRTGIDWDREEGNENMSVEF